MTKQEFIINKIKEACSSLNVTFVSLVWDNQYLKYPEIGLNHLLKTMKSAGYTGSIDLIGRISFTENKRGITTADVPKTHRSKYDLSKSVTENLENQELVDFLADLLGYAE